MLVITVARKPLEGTVASNSRKYGTGALNIDGCRVAFTSDLDQQNALPGSMPGANASIGTFATRDRTSESPEEHQSSLGRWPSNVVYSHLPDCRTETVESWECVDGCPVANLDQQSGVSKSAVRRGSEGEPLDPTQANWRFKRAAGGFEDVGGASRFFKCFKG